MRHILVKSLLLLLFMIPGRCLAGGLSAWEEDTPFHNILAHDGVTVGWVTLTMDTTSLSFKHFYFYKGFIVASADSSYYIIDEEKKTIQEFGDQDKWQQAIKAQHLNPLWKREYDDCYGTDKFGMIFALFVLPIPLFLPLLWITCVISLFFSTRKLIFLRRHFSWIYPTVLLLVLLLNRYPNSI
ncbi:hypothetical protein [Chitinophaga sp. Cy-1792]|uniref:hypothetical protein n=1 Tax=Chitinophaga sp. Cy-1792 TaxID=2608339 RepID=UPI0014232809|nr:hypothetical protein [Chitinophaga sp. Cy-1792]NIG55737.1 hypothetical protein [Chitinophaga sp. Cy-1792]